MKNFACTRFKVDSLFLIRFVSEFTISESLAKHSCLPIDTMTATASDCNRWTWMVQIHPQFTSSSSPRWAFGDLISQVKFREVFFFLVYKVACRENSPTRSTKKAHYESSLQDKEEDSKWNCRRKNVAEIVLCWVAWHIEVCLLYANWAFWGLVFFSVLLFLGRMVLVLLIF